MYANLYRSRKFNDFFVPVNCCGYNYLIKNVMQPGVKTLLRIYKFIMYLHEEFGLFFLDILAILIYKYCGFRRKCFLLTKIIEDR